MHLYRLLKLMPRLPQRSYLTVRKRYSEFDELRAQLMLSFPSFGAAVPGLPPKSIISRFRPTFLEKRRAGLQYFLKYAASLSSF